MRYSEAKQGRIFVIRLEDGDILHEEIERLARDQGIRAAALIVLGGADQGSKLVVGPQEARAMPAQAMTQVLDKVHEVAGVGTLFPDEEGNPSLHMHMASGRATSTVTGCVRMGVRVWHVMEVVLFELVGSPAARVTEDIGFRLLQP